MRSFCAFLIGLAVIFLFYYFVSIPIIPCISIYLTALLFVAKDRNMILRMVFILINTGIATFIYLKNAAYMILFYPDLGNVIGIILEFVTVFAFVASGIFMSMSSMKARRINNYD